VVADTTPTGGAGPDVRRLVPRTDTVLADPRLADLLERFDRVQVKAVVAEAQEDVRRGALDPGHLVDAVLAALPEGAASLQPVLNATGVVLHTNLGRAPLSDAAVAAVVAAAGATDVELDLGTGQRSRRGAATTAALRRAVPSAGAVHVVNNGAAALLLTTMTLGAGREVVVSRGEMVEIGDGFRLPDLVESAGARLREVGTTNRTSLADYERAVGPDTAFVLKVHPSNFVVEGFTSSVAVRDLAGLPVPLVVDIGSGLLAPDPALPGEPDAASALADGADLVTASGDKLLGGPQAGLLLGSTDLVDRVRRHPAARAVRVDKLTLAALEATLLGAGTPTSDALHADPDVLRARTAALAARLRGDGVGADVVEVDGAVGGGGAPGVRLPGWAVAVAESLAAPLRTGRPAVVGRVEQGRLLLDLRCVPPDRDEVLGGAVEAAAAGARGGTGGRAG
jgi:L-seryl-tRNA(Ser) seleniumtransferase